MKAQFKSVGSIPRYSFKWINSHFINIITSIATSGIKEGKLSVWRKRLILPDAFDFSFVVKNDFFILSCCFLINPSLQRTTLCLKTYLCTTGNVLFRITPEYSFFYVLSLTGSSNWTLPASIQNYSSKLSFSYAIGLN